MELTSKNVNKIFMDCLFEEDNEENRKNSIVVEGLVNKFGLNPVAIKKHKKDIYSMLKQLPKNFQKNGGGGWSFLNACNREDGTQWTGLHATMEQLVVLGIASEYVKYTMPREMWKILPGGVPYFSVA
ncbi:hypothetical protein LCGC14_2176970 [marine sediment metagenome]|uniref:Uncharacterized protein n=1 Tax=marine sediment metagenome TaxID=412755 RepID=A0A0F9G140_9ZZZZ|nr:hypothetical protein [Candidatus Aminicenantes bacterium]HEB36115.1 hypothetical protein [Candidatus Aminicenantes bacterium]